jgi:xanthine dehydrogenase large subunit
LSAHAHYATPRLSFDRTKEQGNPFAYHVYGCAAVEVTLDCLRGTYHIDNVYIIHDAGKSLAEDIDRGQIEGGVVQGLGWMTLEEIVHDSEGRLLTDTLTTYKIPDIYYAPDIEVEFLAKSDNPPGIMHSKAIGEPPLMYGIGVYFALAKAIQAFNSDWQADFCAPLTPEKVLLALYGK